MGAWGWWSSSKGGVGGGVEGAARFTEAWAVGTRVTARFGLLSAGQLTLPDSWGF